MKEHKVKKSCYIVPLNWRQAHIKTRPIAPADSKEDFSDWAGPSGLWAEFPASVLSSHQKEEEHKGGNFTIQTHQEKGEEKQALHERGGGGKMDSVQF
jgi:hypothetical protein